MSLLLRLLLAMLFLGATPLMVACDDPCQELEEMVCNPRLPSEQRMLRRHCEIIQERERRELLPGRACKGIMDHLSRAR